VAFARIDSVRIAGLASAVPARTISNLDCPAEQRSERERLVRNIGIETRRQSAPEICFSDLAFTAAERLLEDIAWRRDEIDALIVVTQSADYSYPGSAILLQDRLGLPHTCLAFDINLGCSGYPYGLFTVGSMLAAGKLKKALLLVGDKSTNPDSQDQGFVVLFSDAATATALEYDSQVSPMYFDMYSDGAGYQAIYCPAGGNRVPIQPEHLIRQENEDGVIRRAVDIILNGPMILNFSITRVPPAIIALIEKAGFTFNDIGNFYLHQANRMINDTIRKKLRLEPERFPSTLRDFGNTSSASIPLTITVEAEKRRDFACKKTLLCGFGVGLSWAAAIVDMHATPVCPLIEV